jgi:uroporphyrinogen III methyltransferase/synthase
MATVGRVYLVGAGPGDPGLLTVRGWQLLQAADLVLYDGLVNPLLLHHTSAAAERTCRVEGPDGRRINQSEINERLIAAASEGKLVVRLKGGDPFVFGRGGEEAAALHAAGIPFEVVPGVTAAVAASAYAGISLTHREIASSVALVTGHEDPTRASSRLDYAVLARFPGTLVFYMGLHRLPLIAAELMSAGMRPDIPAAVICRGTWPGQRTVVAEIGTIADAAANAGLRPPSVLIVGECVRQRETTAWFETRPLFGLRIGITRSAEHAEPQIERLVELGAQPIVLPTIRIAAPENEGPLLDAIQNLAGYSWVVFNSRHSVGAVCDRVFRSGRDARAFGSARIATVGPGTAAALRNYGLTADLIPTVHRSDCLADELAGKIIAGNRILWPKANRGRDAWVQRVTAAGGQVTEVEAYRQVDVDAWPADAAAVVARGEIDWIGLSSPATARGVARLLPPEARDRIGKTLRFAAISPAVAVAAEQSGLRCAAVAESTSWDGIFAAIARAEGATGDLPPSFGGIRPGGATGGSGSSASSELSASRGEERGE